MNIASAKSLKIVHGLPPIAKKGDRVALDSEFFGQEKRRLHRPHGRFAFLGASYDGITVYYITETDEIQEFYNRIDAATHIYHNAKYDIRQLRVYANISNRKLLWDTMLVEQIQWSGYYTDFSLADLVRRYLETYLPKEIRQEFSSDTESMTREQIEYSCVDVAYTWRIFQAQREKICDDDLSIWKDIELPFMWTLLSMSGVRMDVEKWSALAEKNGKIAQEIQDRYGHTEIVSKTGRMKKDKEVFTGLNLNSPAQVKVHLQSLGYRVSTTGADFLETISDECDFAKDLCVYRTYSKRASTYGLKFIEDHVELDGKIYADIFQIGAETGRTSCRAPNLQNQPHEVEYRECFIVDDDECMIVADWGSQEPRIAAYLSGDDGLKEALNSDEKLYVRVARDVLNISITKNDEEYKHMKSTVLGIFYGMSAQGLSDAIGVSEEVAQQYINSFLETYPGVEEYMEKQKRAKEFVTSIYGRKIWLNKYSFQWERNALNAPIQSSAADAMKIAGHRLGKILAENGWKLLLLVHDELVMSCPIDDCERAKKLMADCMVQVAEELHDGIKGSVDVFSGSNWACKN